MSEIRVNKLINEAGTGSVELTQGATLPSGKTISGAGAISVTGNVASSGQVSGATGSFTGNVSVGGTLTYEDVTNVDSVGIVTARTGVKVLAGGVNVVGGGITATGIGTFYSGLNTEDILAEKLMLLQINLVLYQTSALKMEWFICSRQQNPQHQHQILDIMVLLH